jgi:hypothetical protein
MITNEKSVTTILAAIGLVGIGVIIGEARQSKVTLKLLEQQRMHEPPHRPPFGCPPPHEGHFDRPSFERPPFERPFDRPPFDKTFDRPTSGKTFSSVFGEPEK